MLKLAKPLYKDKFLLSYLSLMGYGSDKPQHKGPPRLSYTAISMLTGVKASTISYLLKQYRKPAQQYPPLYNRKRLRFRKQHIDYLVRETILKGQAHLSIIQRAKLFHRSFPEVNISATSLRRLYLKHNIRFKLIQRVKKVIDFSDSYYKGMFMTMVDQLNQAKQKNLPIVFLDEAVFTFNIQMSKSWSSAYSNIKVNYFAIKVKTQALIAAINIEGGMLDYVIHPNQIRK